VADAGADVFRSNGIGPLSKWVDDHIFFRIPRKHLPTYNADRAQWRSEIQQQGGQQQEGGRLWYRGKDLLNGHPEEFDEDCSIPLRDWPGSSSCNLEEEFSYSDSEIDAVSGRLGCSAFNGNPPKRSLLGPRSRTWGSSGTFVRELSACWRRRGPNTWQPSTRPPPTHNFKRGPAHQSLWR
jgi:hypothetical protein